MALNPRTAAYQRRLQEEARQARIEAGLEQQQPKKPSSFSRFTKRTFGGWGKDIKKYRIKRKKKRNISPFHENMDFNFGSNSIVDFSSTSGAWDEW